MNTPDLMPILSAGYHGNPSEGACVMELCSYLAGEEWSGWPTCTHPVLAVWAQNVNDELSDQNRHLILSRLPRLMNSAAECGLDEEPLDSNLADALRGWAGSHSGMLAIDGSDGRRLRFLDGLLDEYDRLTGRTDVAPLTADDHTRLLQLTNA